MNLERVKKRLFNGWKTLKDKMEFDGLQFTQISPKLIFKQAFQAQYIDKVEIWLQMTDDRNLNNQRLSNLFSV